jgi:hypothetical protein
MRDHEVEIERIDLNAAPTNTEGFVIASANAPIFTSLPIEQGDEISIRWTQHVTPGGQHVSYASGPKGSFVVELLRRVAHSGGHSHGVNIVDPRSVGTITPDRFQLTGDSPQNIPVTYRAPDVSGAVLLSVEFDGRPTLEHRYEIMLLGLVPIPSTRKIKLKSPRPEHPSPYWADPAFVRKLELVADKYFSETGKDITITDASLQFGGRFDLNGDWSAPHAEHRDGHQADIRSNDMSDSDRRVFRQACANYGMQVLVESDHWHVRG